MRVIEAIVLLFIVTTNTVQSQQAEWNGDSSVCQTNSTIPPSDTPFPTFPDEAQFIMETTLTIKVNNNTRDPMVTTVQYYYDYNANKKALRRNSLGFVEWEHFDYNILEKTTYSPQKYCVVTDIPKNMTDDGGSAFMFPNGTYHIRPLSEFLDFTINSNDNSTIPRYIGRDFLRDIPVDQWEACLVDKINKRTERRVWSFARQDIQTSINSLSNISVPLGYTTHSSILANDGSKIMEMYNEISIFSFKPKLADKSHLFTAPRGTFCPNMKSELVTLSDVGIQWPTHYSVRIGTTTSSGVRSNPLQLYIDNNEKSKRARFDYLLDDQNNYQTTIIDYQEQVKYVIDQTRGVCNIIQGVDWPDVSPGLDPVKFFMKMKTTLLDQPPKTMWQYRGIRRCRGSLTLCVIYTMSMNNYPPIIDPATSKPTGENWDEMHAEYAWSKRHSNSTPVGGQSPSYDYPVSLLLRSYQMNATPTGNQYRWEEVEYEFYEMSPSLPYDAFDISVCYRSRDWPYLHLAFTVKLDQATAIVDSNHLDRKELHHRFLNKLLEVMNPIRRMRIHQLEVDHDITADINTLYVVFLLLGPTPVPDLRTHDGLSTVEERTDQISVEMARDQLRTRINDGSFVIDVQLLDDDRTRVNFKAVSDSLQNIREFLSSHALVYNAGNKTVLQTNKMNTTQTLVNFIVLHEEKVVWKWSRKAQTSGIVGGLMIGLAVAVIVTLAIKLKRKKEAPTTLSMTPLSSFTNVVYSDQIETNTSDKRATNASNSAHSNA